MTDLLAGAQKGEPSDSEEPETAAPPIKTLPPSRLRPIDVITVGSTGIRTRRLRTALSALGITIGIAAMVAVLGISESSRAGLKAQIEALGTNLLQVTPTVGIGSGDGQLPAHAVSTVRRIGPVREVGAVVELEQSILRNDVINETETAGVTVFAADLELLETLNGGLTNGVWLDEAKAQTQSVVLGATAAQRLGIERVDAGLTLLIGGEWFTVIGVLERFPLADQLDTAALIGRPIAASLFESELHPSTIYVRSNPERIEAVRRILGPTIDPQSPDEVSITRPSELLEAQEATDSAFRNLFLGLGAVSLFVGGVGIANVMVIAVIERRNEIGLRRALGATQAHIRRQFLAEALLLSAIGGVFGVGFGSLLAAVYARGQDWSVVIPPSAIFGGLASALIIGVVAGLYPAGRAARLAPTEALRAA